MAAGPQVVAGGQADLQNEEVTEVDARTEAGQATVSGAEEDIRT
jgi:hypothetical protein